MKTTEQQNLQTAAEYLIALYEDKQDLGEAIVMLRIALEASKQAA